MSNGLRPERAAAASGTLPHFPLSIFSLACGLALSGCSLFMSRPPAITEPINLIAVMPLVRSEPHSATPSPEGPPLAPDAERVVTAEVYGVLSSSSRWRFVPDLTVAPALAHLPASGDLATRAQALGKAVGADAVLIGSVFRFRERVGSEYGARQPAAVGFTLQLISVSSGHLLWSGTFDQAQQSLSTNLFNWWQFWQGGPRWFTAAEFAGIGANRLLDNLAEQLGW